MEKNMLTMSSSKCSYHGVIADVIIQHYQEFQKEVNHSSKNHSPIKTTLKFKKKKKEGLKFYQSIWLKGTP